MKKTVKHLVIGMALSAFLLSLLAAGAEAADSLGDWLLEKATTEAGFSRDAVQPGNVQRIVFPLSGLTVYQVKLVDGETGETYASVMDETGAARSLENARQAEAAAHDARLAQLLAEDSGLSVDEARAKIGEATHGRLNSNLFDRLDAMDSAGTLTVAIWLRADDVSSLERFDFGHRPAKVEAGDAPLALKAIAPGKKPAPKQVEENLKKEGLDYRIDALREAQDEVRSEIEEYRQENLNFIKSQISALREPLQADLDAIGVSPKYMSPVAPLVYVELSKSEILSLVLKGYVDTIYGPNINRDTMNTAKPTQKADIVDNWFGFDGTGVDVAICEDSRIDWPHTYLSTGTTRVPGDANVDNHATACAGMVASLHGTYQGIAQGSNMFSANGTSYSDVNMAAAIDWAAITKDVDVLNNSWGGNDFGSSMNDHDRHLDYVVRHYFCTVTVAAGNEGTSASHYVGSPAKAYNVISVGAYSDNGTLTWDDDAMGSYSSYNNPATGCEKPEVAASGSSITSTLMGNAVANAGSGTSFSTPMVSGETALLMDRDINLQPWPEAVKAIIMATALHNIEGASRLSGKDGAGGVDMRAAFRVVDEGWWEGKTVYQNDLPQQYSFYAYAGQKIRAAIAWDSNPNASYTTDVLEADIDLRLKNPSGTIVSTSASGSNSFEVIEYTATVTGTYTIEAYVYSWSGSGFTYLGAAWWPGQRALSTAIQTYDTPPVSRDYYQFTPYSGYWNVVGIRSPSASTSSNYNIYLYSNSAFGDPDDYELLEDSTLSSVFVDYVVVDRNHAPAGDYFTEVRAAAGSGNYPIQWWSYSSTAPDGTYSLNIEPYFVLKIWDCYLSAGTRKYFSLKTSSGDADLGMALHDSTPGTSSTYYQGRSNRVIQADSSGAGGSEFMNYQTTTSDDMGLVVWNNGATQSTSFTLYVDSTPPTGSININGGAAYTNSTAVSLTLSATDSQTGVAEMRFGNTGAPWSAWEPYGTSKPWIIPAGDGSKSVWVQFKNNAGQISSQTSDSILLDTTAPTPNPMTWATVPYELNTSQIRMVATTASDSNTPIRYYFDYTSSPTGGPGGSDSGWISGTAFTDSGLGANHQYGYRVRARDGSYNMTGYSATSYDYTDIETPTGITFGTITTSSIQARSANTPSGLTRGSSGLYIYNATTGVSSGWNQNNNYWTNSGLSPNTRYGFRATARNGDANQTGWSATSYRYTRANLPGAAAFSNVTQTSIRANWTANGNPAGTLYWCENTTAGVNSGWITATSWNNTGLSPDTSYSYRVKARNGNSVETSWRSLGSQTTLSGAAPCEGDFDSDGDVDGSDLSVFAADFGRTDCGSGPPCEGDFEPDGDVDGSDLAVFAADFGRTDCP